MRAGDDAEFRYARCHVHLEGVLYHGFPPDGEEFLREICRERSQPKALAGSRDHGFCDVCGHENLARRLVVIMLTACSYTMGAGAFQWPPHSRGRVRAVDN